MNIDEPDHAVESIDQIVLNNLHDSNMGCYVNKNMTKNVLGCMTMVMLTCI